MDFKTSFRAFIDSARAVIGSGDDEATVTRQLREPMARLIATPGLTEPFGLPRPDEGGAYLLYKDPVAGFILRAQVVHPGRTVPPHDHGPFWAVYGGYVGHTIVRTWVRLDDRLAEGRATVRPVTEFAAQPGDVAIFHSQIIHQPVNATDQTATFLTIYNGDLSQADRYVYEPALGQARLARHGGLQDRPDHVDLTAVLAGI